MSVIGKGSCSTVFLVRCKTRGTLYAMKVTSISHIQARGEVAHTKNELLVLSTLPEHPFIVTCHYAFKDTSYLYLILDYCPGGELFYLLQKTKKFPEDITKFIIAQLISGYEHLHKAGIMYRGGKPEDIVITGSGHIKMVDFNLAKIDSVGTTFCGTPEYLAPEVLMGNAYTNAVDLYSIGTLTYELLTGLPPFYDVDVQAMYTRIMTSALKLPEPPFHPQLADFVGCLLQREPKKRPSIVELKKHPWLGGVDWETLTKQTHPFLVPQLRSPEDVSYFDDSFTKMAIDHLWQGQTVPVVVDEFPDWYYDATMSLRGLERFPRNYPEWPPFIKDAIKEVSLLASRDTIWREVPMELLLVIMHYYLLYHITLYNKYKVWKGVLQ
uniref:Protein kinase domain-containing protein n=1 Tax=Arcella intermedia TaxID=1963864 RepID=A0A6B2L640_9EUKA